jgi:hypothetical protein
MIKSFNFKWRIVGVLIFVVLLLAAFIFVIQPLEKNGNLKNCLETVEWCYIEDEIITPPVLQNKVKDPEFFRFSNHSLFKDEQGYYYVIFSFKNATHMLPGILKTKNFIVYEFFGVIPNLNGKIAPYVLFNSKDGKFYMFYSDWVNVIEKDIKYARLGLAVGEFSEEFSSIKFEDKGYLKIAGSPLVSSEAGWDPYIVKIDDGYYMVFSSAQHGVHLAKASKLGKSWTYVDMIVADRRENPALFFYKATWYMLIGIYDGRGYDLYSSKDFLTWDLLKRNWFIDEKYPTLPAGSTIALVDSTLYHLYQVPLGRDMVYGPFSLKLAICELCGDS